MLSAQEYPKSTPPAHPGSPEKIVWFRLKVKEASNSAVTPQLNSRLWLYHLHLQGTPLLEKLPILLLRRFKIKISNFRFQRIILNLCQLNRNKAISQIVSPPPPVGTFLLESCSSLLLPLPGEEVPPGVEGLVVEEEEGAASQVAEEGGKDANQQELIV